MLQPHTGRISLQRPPPFFLPSLRPLEAIYLTMARRHHILLFRRLAVARSSRARTGIVKRRRVTIASWLRGRRFEFEFRSPTVNLRSHVAVLLLLSVSTAADIVASAPPIP